MTFRPNNNPRRLVRQLYDKECKGDFTYILCIEKLFFSCFQSGFSFMPTPMTMHILGGSLTSNFVLGTSCCCTRWVSPHLRKGLHLPKKDTINRFLTIISKSASFVLSVFNFHFYNYYDQPDEDHQNYCPLKVAVVIVI